MNDCEQPSDFVLFIVLATLAVGCFIILMECSDKLRQPIDCKSLKSEIELCHKFHSKEYCDDIYLDATCEGET